MTIIHLHMLGHWLSTGLYSHIVYGPVHWANSLLHTWSHRWSCSYKVQWGGCSSYYVHWSWCGSKLDTVQLWQVVKKYFLCNFNIWNNNFDIVWQAVAIPWHRGTGWSQCPLAWHSSWGAPTNRKPSSQWKWQEELKRLDPKGCKQLW